MINILHKDNDSTHILILKLPIIALFLLFRPLLPRMQIFIKMAATPLLKLAMIMHMMDLSSVKTIQ